MKIGDHDASTAGGRCAFGSVRSRDCLSFSSTPQRQTHFFCGNFAARKVM